MRNKKPVTFHESKAENGKPAYFVKLSEFGLNNAYRSSSEKAWELYHETQQQFEAMSLQAAQSKITYEHAAASRVAQLNHAFEKDEIEYVTVDGHRKINAIICAMTVECPRKNRYMQVGKLEMNDICKQTVKNIVIEIGKTRTPKTVYNYMGPFKSVFDHAVENDWCKNNTPAQIAKGTWKEIIGGKKKKKKLAKRIATPIINAVFECVQQNLKLPFEFSVKMGVRSGELRALQWEQIDFETKQVVITRALKRGKGCQIVGLPKTDAGHRRIGLTDDLTRKLKAWRLLSPHSRDTDLVFTGRYGGMLGANSLNGCYGSKKTNRRAKGLKLAIETAAKKHPELKIEDFTWHDLRHYFASILIFDKNFTVLEIMHEMGHAEIRTTLANYGHWLDDPKRDEDLRLRKTAALD